MEVRFVDQNGVRYPENKAPIKKYTYHGYMVVARELNVGDKDGTDFESNENGDLFVITSIGKEYFVPGDYLVTTDDRESVTRLRQKVEFEAFAKEEPVETGRVPVGGSLRSDVHGKGKLGSGPESIGASPKRPKIRVTAGKPGGCSPSQRSAKDSA
jgi:hypothetical protein